MKAVFYNLILKVTSRGFCSTLLYSLSRIHQVLSTLKRTGVGMGRRGWEGGNPRAILEGRLPQPF